MISSSKKCILCENYSQILVDFNALLLFIVYCLLSFLVRWSFIKPAYRPVKRLCEKKFDVNVKVFHQI